jgi:spore germination protein YaaH
LPEKRVLVSEKDSPSSPVFYDPRGRRWRHVRRTYLALGVVITAVVAVFIASVLANPLLPRLNLRPLQNLPHSSDIKPQPPAVLPNLREAKARKAQAELQKALSQTRVVPAKRSELMPIVPPPATTPLPTPASFGAKQMAIGFYINWDESSYASLKRNLDSLDWVVPQWVHIVDAKSGSSPIEADLDAAALNLIREKRPQISILPMVQNLSDEKWEKEILARAVGDEGSRQRLIAALIQFVAENKFAGLCIDFEEPTAETQPKLLRFMLELYTAFQPRGWIVVQAVPFDDAEWNYRAYAAATDYLMLMAYDEHWAGKIAGSVASQSWYETNLATRMRELNPAKTIIALGNYGYNWTEGASAEEVSFQKAVIDARDSEAQIEFDPNTGNPHYEYDEEDESHHTVWFLDGVTAFNQMRAASGYHPAGFALWRLGSEDPSIWSIFGTDAPNPPAEALKRIVYGYEVDF